MGLGRTDGEGLGAMGEGSGELWIIIIFSFYFFLFIFNKVNCVIVSVFANPCPIMLVVRVELNQFVREPG